jgi:signal transduction histidine kinase
VRWRLILLSAAVTTLVVLAFLVPLAVMVRQLARDRVIAGAERDAGTVARLVSSVDTEDGMRDVFAALGGSELNANDLSLLLPSGDVLGTPLLPDEDVERASSGAAYRDSLSQGEVVYAPFLSSGGVGVVRVLVEEGQLNVGVVRSWATLGLLGVALIIVAMAVAAGLGRSMVGPVEDLAAAAHSLGEGDLTVRVSPAGPPETVAVGLVFNRLAERITHLLQNEREAAADLSHRLRTPLTAVRLDAEAIAPGAARDRVLEDLDDLERMVDFIIEEARRPARQDAAPLTDLVSVARERFEFWQALGDEQARRGEFAVEGPRFARVRAPAQDLATALDALLGNVFAHTRDGTAYRVSVEGSRERVRLVVEDDGSGFATDDLLNRGASGAGSTGLGLDIARRTAEAAAGRIVLGSSPSGGARVVLEFAAEHG